MKKGLIIVFVFSSLVSFSQKEANNWYFGHYAAINFNTSPPTPLIDCPMNTGEGSSTISDNKGNLLFSTDGVKIYNRNQKLMKNGTGLFGSPTSAQSAIIVRKPNSKTIYYVFTVSGFTGDTKGYNFSTVDLSEDYGLGAVISKNTPLIYSTTSKSESITACYHSNNRDVWIICYDSDKQRFANYLVTPSGVNTTPVLTSCTNGGGFYCAKVSQNGLKYAVSSQAGVLLADFNTTSGQLSNINSLSSSFSYGIEFSPSNKFLYYTTTNEVFQFDISQKTLTGIINSKTQVGNGNYLHAMQLGPDKKIWLAVAGDTTLSVLHYPDKKDTASKFSHKFLGLKKKSGGLGLPTFFQSYFSPKYSYKGDCLGDTTWFILNDTISVDSVLWNFGDTISKKNTARGIRVFHLFSDVGEFKVRSIAYKDQMVDTTYILVNQNLYYGKLSGFPKEIIKCFDDTITLSMVNPAGYKIKWSTGSDSNSIRVVDSGFLSLKKYYGSKCYADDTVKIIFYKNNIVPGNFSLGNDLVKCYYDSIRLACPDPKAYKYKWSNGISNIPFYASQPIKVSLVAYFEGSCYKTDTIEISNFNISKLNLGPDTFFCAKNPILIGDWNQGFNNYYWNTGAKTPFIIPDTPGRYSLLIKDAYWCSYYDTINVNAYSVPKVNLGPDTLYCDNFVSRLIDAKNTNQINQYNWNTGGKKQIEIVNKPGKYWVRVSNTCGSSIDTINLKFLTKPKLAFPDEIIFCDTLAIKLDAVNANNNVNYYWNTKEATQIIFIKDTGIYKARVSNNCGKDSASVHVIRCLKYITIDVVKACINQPVDFSIPSNLKLDSLKWNFGDTSSINNISKNYPIVSHSYKNFGDYKINLVLFYKGRKDTIRTTVSFVNPKPDFTVSDVCENDSVRFKNVSIEKIELSFKWKFGDGQNSVLVSPAHFYPISGISQTFNVGLVGKTADGCSDSITQAVTVNANPISDFSYTANYSVVDFKAAKPGNTLYKWLFGNGDSATTSNSNYKYTYPNSMANYQACLQVTDASGCFSKTCKDINVSAGISSLTKANGFKIYPNPNQGNFTIEIENLTYRQAGPSNDVSIEVFDVLGSLVKKVEKVEKVNSIEMDLANGVYLVKIKNGEMVFIQKLVINKD